MKDENFGIVAGLASLASITAFWIGHSAIGLLLGTISIAFAVRLGLSKRYKGQAGQMARQVPPPPDYPFTPDDWEGGIGRCSSCDGSGIDPRLPDEQDCNVCGGSGQVSPPDAYLAAIAHEEER